MEIQAAQRVFTDGRDLSEQKMAEGITQVMNGDATPSRIAGFPVGLRMKAESVGEIAGAAGVRRRMAIPAVTPFKDLVDVVGTGGDSAGTFNNSTACAFVAAAGGRIAKHGNRAISSRSGSADLLEAVRVRVDFEAA